MRQLLLLLAFSLLALGSLAEDEEHFLDVKQLVKGTIQAMSRLPKAAIEAANANKTDAKERKEEDEGLYSLFRLPADIMTQIAEDAGYIEEEKEEKSTVKPWIITKKKDTEEDEDEYEEDDDSSSSFKQAKPHKKSKKHSKKSKKERKEYDEDGLISLESIFKQSPSNQNQPSTLSPIAPLPTFFPPMSFVQETTTIRPSAVQPRLAYQQVIRDGKTFYEPVYILPPVAGMPLPTLSSMPLAMTPSLTDIPPQGVPILNKDSILLPPAPSSNPPPIFVTPKPAVVVVDSSSHSFSPPTFPPQINPFKVEDEMTSRVTAYPTRRIPTRTQPTQSPEQADYHHRVSMFDYQRPRQFASKTLQLSHPRNLQISQMSSLFTTQQPPVSEQTEQTEIYSEEATVTQQPRQAVGQRKYQSSLARIPVDKHFSHHSEESDDMEIVDEVEEREDERSRDNSRERAEDLRNSEDRQMEDDEEIPYKAKKHIKHRKRKTVRRLKVPLDDEMPESSRRQRLMQVEPPPIAQPASEKFVQEFSEMSDNSGVDVEMERQRLHKRLMGAGGIRRRRIHASKIFTPDDHMRKSNPYKASKEKIEAELESFDDKPEKKKKMRRVTIRRQMLTKSAEQQEEEQQRRERIEEQERQQRIEEQARRQREEAEAEARSRERKRREEEEEKERRMREEEEEYETRRKGQEESEEVVDDNVDDVDDEEEEWEEVSTTTSRPPRRRQLSSRSREKMSRERSHTASVSREKYGKYKKRKSFEPSRAHCLNIRSFARQFGILDAVEFATAHCEFIENYYPELRCSNTADYMSKCERHYNA